MVSNLRSTIFLMLLTLPFGLFAQKWDTLATIPANFTFPVVVAVDGKIHIMGGGGDGGATTLHYAYDPATDMWDQKANIPFASQQPAGAATDSKIHYFGGGFPNSGTPVDDHYIYDVASDTWTQAADLTAPRAIHNAVAIDGDIYSIGGQGMSTLFQRYDADSDKWENQATLPDNQFWYGAHVAGNDGKYYRFCGGGYTSPVNGADVYSPDSDTWLPLPNFPAATHGLKAAAIGDKIYLTGGYHTFAQRDELYEFDPETLEYTLTNAPLPIGRNYHSLVSIDSCLYVVGGFHSIEEISNVLRTQLIRYCPSGDISSVTQDKVAEPLNVRYANGELILQLPEDIDKNAQFQLHDMSGRLIYSENLTNTSSLQQSFYIGSLTSSIYVASVRSNQRLLVRKVSVN